MKSSRGSSRPFDETLSCDGVKLGYKLVDGNVGCSGKKVMLLFRVYWFLKAQSRWGTGFLDEEEVWRTPSVW